MKITENHWRQKIVHDDLGSAVKSAVEDGAANCDGQIERLQGRVDALVEIVGRLVNAMPANTPHEYKLNVESILGSKFEVEF